MSNLNNEQIAGLAEHLETAQLERFDVTKVTDDYPDMDFRDAYAVQKLIQQRKQERGDRLVGYKMGLTSRAKMQQMGVDSPVYGFLMSSFECQESSAVPVDRFIHPRVEAEIAFVLKEELQGPGCTVARVLAATDFVMPAIEIIDSRYRDFKFDLVSVIADNASSSGFVTGSTVAGVEGLDMRTLGVVLEINGEPMEVGAGAAVLGHPANSIAQLVNMLAETGESLPAGSLVLSGAITAALPVKAGDCATVRAHGLGSATVRFV